MLKFWADSSGEQLPSRTFWVWARSLCLSLSPYLSLSLSLSLSLFLFLSRVLPLSIFLLLSLSRLLSLSIFLSLSLSWSSGRDLLYCAGTNPPGVLHRLVHSLSFCSFRTAGKYKDLLFTKFSMFGQIFFEADFCKVIFSHSSAWYVSLGTDRYSSQFKDNCFTEMWSGSEVGSYVRLIDFCITQHSAWK